MIITREKSKYWIVLLLIEILNYIIYMNGLLYERLLPIFIFPILVLLAGGFLFVNYRLQESEIVILSFFCITIMLISVFNRNSIGAVIAAFVFFLIPFFFKNIKLDKEYYLFLFSISIVPILYYLFKVSTSESISVNTNAAGMSVFIAYILLRVSKCKLMNKVTEWITIISFLLVVYVEFKLRCRTIIVILVLYLIFEFILPRSFWKNKLAICGILILIFAVGVYVPFHFIHYGTEGLNVLNGLSEAVGKSNFGGREQIWYQFALEMNNNWRGLLFGVGSYKEYIFGRGLSLHNSYIQIMMNFGSVGVAIWLFYLIFLVDRILRNPVNEMRRLLIIFLICFLIMGVTEVTIQSPQTILVTGFLIGIAMRDDIVVAGEKHVQNK